MRVTNELVGLWLQVLQSTDCYASLHTDEPNVDDPLASEVSGAAYYRPRLQWELMGNRALCNAGNLGWGSLDPTVISAVGVFTAPTGGDLLMYAVLRDPVHVSARSSYEVAARTLYLRVEA